MTNRERQYRDSARMAMTSFAIIGLIVIALVISSWF